jgi:transposase
MLPATFDRATLPNAIEALRDQVGEQMACLAHQLADLRRRLYGPRSEVLHVQQGELLDDTVEVPLPIGHFDDVAVHRRRVEHDLSDEDKAQYRRVQRIGEDAVETLEYTPARLEVRQHARPKYRCEDAHGSTTIRTARAQPSPIAKCNAGAGLLAQMLVVKYADHLLLARQERIFARHGASLSRQTLYDWALASAELLRPLMVPLHRHVLSCPVIFADDTEVALYDFTCSRAGEHPRRILQGWSGYLQADDFSGHQALFRSGAITHAACWAHVRRHYEPIVKPAPKGSPPAIGARGAALHWRTLPCRTRDRAGQPLTSGSDTPAANPAAAR